MNDTERQDDRKRFARAVFRSILFGSDEIPESPWPSVRCWEPRPREDLTDPIMLAQRRDRRRPRIVLHGPIVRGVLQPIRKGFDWLHRRWLTNEVY